MENKVWEVVVNNHWSGADKGWPIFENGTLIAVVHAGYEVAKQICERHNHGK